MRGAARLPHHGTVTNSTGPDVIGREAACTEVVDALTNDRPVVLTGEAGIGKSSLARAAIAATGRRRWEGAGYATLTSLPYVTLRLALGLPVSGSPADVAARVEAVVGDGVLLVDDLQWVDRSSLKVLPLLAGRIGLVVTSRDRDATLGTDPSAARARRIRVEPLGAADAEQLARRVAPGIPSLALRQIIQRSGGNPLLLEELARDGRESPTVSRAFRRHLAEASPAGRHAMCLLAIADRPLPGTAIGSAAHELLELGLVRGSGDDVEIRHALIAEALIADLDPAARREAHREVAGLATTDLDAAFHLARADRRADAVTRALAGLAHTDDIRTRAALLRIAAEASDGPESLDLHARAAEAALDNEDIDTAAGLLATALPGGPGSGAARGADAEVAGRLEQLALATCHLRGDPEGAEAAWLRATALPIDPSGLVARQLATERAIMLGNRGRLDEAIAVLDEGDAADVLRDPANVAARANLRALLRFFAGEDVPLEDLEAWAEEAVVERAPRATARVTNVYSVTLATRGTAAAASFLDTWVPRLEAIDAPAARLECERVQVLLFLGRAADAIVAADDQLERPIPGSLVGAILVNRAEACCLLGRFVDVQAGLARAEPYLSDEWMHRGEALTTAAHAAYWAGRPKEAVALAEATHGVASNYAGNRLLTTVVQAWACRELGLPIPALPDAPPSWVRDGAVAEIAALVEAASGRPSVEAFDQAAAAWGDNHVFRSLVCAWGAGEAARRAGDASAAERLRAVLAEAEGRGFEPLAARVRRSMRLTGVRVRHRAPAIEGRGLLTAREREVLELVAAGQSNAEIARRMGLGRPTVTTMLSSAMGKLGADTRAHAVSLAQLHG